MTHIEIDNGLTLPLAGRPEPQVMDGPSTTRVALQPPDFRYLRPRLKVREGDSVKVGTVLMEDKDDTRIRFVSPGGGKVVQIRYGERRKPLEIIIETDKDEKYEEFEKLTSEAARKLERAQISERLLAAGLWPMIRQRPFSRIAQPDVAPKTVFVNAMAEDPFDVDPNAIIAEQGDMLQLGIDLLGKLTDGGVHLCIGGGASAKPLVNARNCEVHRFSGPYPVGSPAVQIYYVAPPQARETAWYVSAQNAVAIARFFTTGRYPIERIISVCGAAAKERFYFRSRVGASVDSLTQGKVEPGELRHVSGGILTGRRIDKNGFIGYYDTVLYVIKEGGERELLSFVRPGFDKFSLSRTFMSSLVPGGSWALDTTLRGSIRNFVMNGIYEDLCPVDILPQYLAKSILAGDIEETEKHGILDCAECGLCTFVCPSKIEIGEIISRGLNALMKEG
ncbi:MAG: Na(+)-translocating NADH-quinone reductase subunit A [Elusimicrobiota bacterium]